MYTSAERATVDDVHVVVGWLVAVLLLLLLFCCCGGVVSVPAATNCTTSVAIVVIVSPVSSSFTRLAHLLPASEQLGPLLVSFGRMIHNVIQFSIIFVVVFVAFMCGLTSLYRVHQCENVHFTRLVSV